MTPNYKTQKQIELQPVNVRNLFNLPEIKKSCNHFDLKYLHSDT